MVMAETKQCIPGSTYIKIISKDNYAINENIDNITIKLEASAIDITKAKVTSILYDNSIEKGTRLSNGFTNQVGEVKIDFKYKPTKSGELSIYVIVNDGTREFKTQKKIYVKPTIDTKLNCEVLGYVGRYVSCEWKSYDADNGNLIITTPTIGISQGQSQLVYETTGSTNIKFKTDTTGSVEVKLKTEKDGYIPDADETIVEIQSLQRSQKFTVDNKDFFDYPTGLTIGTHELKFRVEESGEAIEIQTVNAKITTPSFQTIQLSFYKTNNIGEYKATYNFLQPGQTYDLSGTIIFKDYSKEPIQFQYKITTTASQTETMKNQFTYIIIGASVAGVGLIFIILRLVFRKKK